MLATGALSSELHHVGFQTVLGVDQNPVWELLFHALHVHDAPDFLEADAGSSQTARATFDKDIVHGTGLAGLSCQPFSKMGDEAGMADSRAGSLEEVPRISWATQSVAILLECVLPVLKHVEFQATL